MLTAFGRAFKTPDLRRKILFTLSIIAVYRLGAHVPTPGVSYPLVQQCIEGADNTNGLLGLVNLFSGGALLQLSIFALGIMPYITASIIIQLLTVVIPRFEALKKEGQAGQTKMTQYTRYLTIGLAILQSSTLITFAQNPQSLFNNPACTNILTDDSVVTILIMVLTMTAGTGMIMWLGELVTDKGIGNGMSILIFTSIAARLPQLAVGHPAAFRLDRLPRHHPDGLRRHRPRRLRRAEPAPHPGAVRQADGGAPRLRRHVDLHPAQGQHGRRHPGHLRQLAALAADAAGPVQPALGRHQPRLGRLDQRPPGAR